MNNAQNVMVDTDRGKDNVIMWYCCVYNQIASDIWRYQ